MIASWMLYSIVCAIGLSIAAIVAERVLIAGRGPVRYVWAGAVILSLIVPAVAHRVAPRRAIEGVVASTMNEDAQSDSADAAAPVISRPSSPLAGASGAAPEASPKRNADGWSWRSVAVIGDRPLIVFWLLLSAALAAHFALGFAVLAHTRRRWTQRDVLGVQVLVSDNTGPALVGAVTPAIVMPRWTLDLAPHHLGLMLRHEQEHQRAHDGQLLFAAQLALIVMPWNVALWWQLARLRVAVELDCDARVLRDADERAYGNLLLEVVRPRMIFAPMGVASFSEQATQLERRIRVMTDRRRGRAMRGARALAGLVAVSTGTIAWLAPHPDVPVVAQQSAPVQAPAQHDSAPNLSQHATPPASTPSVSRPTTPPAKPPVDSAKPAPAVTVPAVPVDSAVRGDSALTVPIPVPGGGGRGNGRGNAAPPNTDLVYGLLFADITLTPDQEVKARAVINNLIREQTASQDSARIASVAFNARNAELRGVRDSVLFTLATTDSVRNLLRSRIGPAGGGQRGGGRGNAPVNGNGTGRGNAPPDSAQLVDGVFQRFFEGIALTTDLESRARNAIARFQAEQRAMTPPRAQQLIAPRPGNGTVLIDIRGDAALIALMTNDADREKLRSRMVNPQPPIQLPGRTP